MYADVYTVSVARTVPAREFRASLAEHLDDVADRREHVIVTRNGRPAAALVPIDEYEALEETAEILSDAGTMAAIAEGLEQVGRDEVTSLDDLRAEVDRKRPPR